MRFAVLLLSPALMAATLPIVDKVEFQPLSAQANRVVQALEILGEAPIGLKRSLSAANTVEAIQTTLDKLCIAGIHINPEGRVKVEQGEAKPELIQNGWRTFLVKVHNESGTTAVLAMNSPNSGPLAGSTAPNRRWLDHRDYNKQPMKPHLGGLAVEYRILQLFSRDPGKREAKLIFDTGQGSQDLGFRSEVDILFSIAPSTTVKFRVKDHDGKPQMASFEVRWDPLESTCRHASLSIL